MFGRALLIAALAGMLACLWSAWPLERFVEAAEAVKSEGSREVIRSRAFLSTRRPPVVFAHNQHNRKVGLDDCSVCHHGGQGFQMDRKDVTTGVPCSQCHKTEMPDGGTRLMQAYHRQCMGCHDQKSRGPQACGECHVLSK